MLAEGIVNFPFIRVLDRPSKDIEFIFEFPIPIFGHGIKANQILVAFREVLAISQQLVDSLECRPALLRQISEFRATRWDATFPDAHRGLWDGSCQSVQRLRLCWARHYPMTFVPPL